MPSTVLSIDLDFFVEPKAQDPESDDRLPEGEYVCEAPESALAYIRRSCAMPAGPVPGAIVRDHHEIVAVLDECVASRLISPPFKLVHLDAHSDSGQGDAAWHHVLTELVHLPTEQRLQRREQLNLANWLLYAVAFEWLYAIVHVRGPEHGGDWLHTIFRNGNVHSSLIELIPLRPGVRVNSSPESLRRLHRNRPSAHTPVPVHEPLKGDLCLSSAPDMVVICQSPQYTPASADATLDALATLLRPLPGRESILWTPMLSRTTKG